jgi:hypothetical protein
VKFDPDEIDVTVFPAKTPLVSTATGEEAETLVAFPNWPEPLFPQQYAWPVAIAQTWLSPAEILVTVFPDNAPVVVTGTGIREVTEAEFPSCPLPPSPQQNTDPDAIAQAKLLPTVTDVTTLPAKTPEELTGTGTVEFSEVPFPKLVYAPQQ